MVLCAVLCTFLWGSAYPVIKSGYAVMNIVNTADKIMFAGVRFFVAGIMVLLFSLVYKRKFPVLEKKEVLPALIFGFVQTALVYLFNYIGVANTTATRTSLLTSLPAFLAVLFAPLFFKDERLNSQKIIGCVIGLLGVAVVNTGSFDVPFSFMGDGLIIVSMVCNTFGGFIGKKVSNGKAAKMTAYQLLFGGLMLIALSLAFGGKFMFSLRGASITFYLAFVSAVAFLLWTYLLTLYEAGEVLVFNLLIPIFGAVWSFVLLKEKDMLNPAFIISTLLVSIGIILVNFKNKKS